MLHRSPVNGSAQGESSGLAAYPGGWEFNQVLEYLPAGAYTCDPGGLITYYNRRATGLWGRSPRLNDPIDRFCGSFKLYSAEGAPIRHDQCWMALALQNRQGYNGHEILVERPDGQRLTVLAYANPFLDAAGALLGAVNVLVDISERKQGEEALRQADRSKDEFLATLAHELRNPLAPLRNAVQILRARGQTTPDAKWAMDVIERQTGQMTRLVDDLLDISRITRNKLELRRHRVDLAAVVAVTVETSRPLIDAAGHELIVTLPKQPLTLDADLTRLAQSLSNLLNNAAKYTDCGGRIWLTVEREGSDAVITVRDTGMGISAEMLPRVFEMFTQVDRSLDHAQGGLGIGLTLVKRLVEMHGGSVEVRSDGHGKGSLFIVRLPVVLDAKAPTRPLTVRGGRKRARSDGDPAGLRILVADDNPDSAKSLGMLLKLAGNETRTAFDGLEAVGVADEFRPDVILLDIGMPRMNGYDAARHIRGQSWGERAVLIALTGWGQDGDKRRSLEAGFDHHLVKPLETGALMRLLESLKGATAGRQAR